MIADNIPSPCPAVQRHTRYSWLPCLSLPSLGLASSERALMLGLVDLALLAVALIIAVKTRSSLLDAPGAIWAKWRWFVTLGVLWWSVAQLADAYDLARAASAPDSILTAGVAAAVTAMLYQMIPVFTPPLTSRKLGIIFALVSVGLIALWRGLYAVLFVQPAFERHLLVFGAGRCGRTLAEALGRTADAGTPNPYRGTGAIIVGFVDDAAVKGVPQTVSGIAVRGTSADLAQLARELIVDEVVLAITNANTLSQAALDALVACREQGFRVTTMPVFYERLLGRVAVEYVGRNMHAVFPEDETSFAQRLYPFVKRGGDLLTGVVGLLALMLTIPIVGLANALTSPGPLFYRQVRLGKGGRPFKIIKYRTMRPNAEYATGAVWAGQDDPRITPAGRWLRRSRLDELPQVLNILRGEMSLIGPRPERPEFVDRLAEQIPFYRARHAVQPGITGWAQVRFGYGATVEEARVKLEYDLYYIRHVGLYLDTIIALKTAAVMFNLRGK
jgi:exopolysaccharide biosynthesis polyprenyl glycosylphosphotransferase